MNKDLYEFKEIDEKIKNKLNYIKADSDIMYNNINEVKALKNDIYEKTSKVFTYNLRKLIQLESTQKSWLVKLVYQRICYLNINQEMLSHL
ncbi:heme oxygenase [Clostridium beijerinckii]|nr:heme oxygenase [Clostridium beijerinckii]